MWMATTSITGLRGNITSNGKISGLESLIGLGWCDFRRLGEHMIDRSAEQITEIKYFTAEVQKDFPRHAGERRDSRFG